MDKFTNQYSFLDRVLHKLAFNTYGVQTIFSSIEDDFFAKQLSKIEIQKPVFITALPRAGTTLLLELCAETQEFASHCYRDMPFVLTPLLWNSFSKGFQQTGELQERAHGDGMLVNADSYEAFEEIVWKVFWKKHYKKNSIIPWNKENNDDFDFFLRNHMRKIISLRSSHEKQMRYVSKNNLNIARLPLLQQIFPDAIIIIPFRDPLQHATSLLRQHLNFVEMHHQDSFSKDYMQAIGHFDFGLNLRPVNFSEWLELTPYKNPLELSFWLAYWNAAYSYLLNSANHQVKFISFDRLCQNPEHFLQGIADTVKIEKQDSFIAQARNIKAVRAYQIDTNSIANPLMERVNTLHSDLLEAAIQ